eukprot:1139034-Pelagomonas_calceolata.AAC.3
MTDIHFLYPTLTPAAWLCKVAWLVQEMLQTLQPIQYNGKEVRERAYVCVRVCIWCMRIRWGARRYVGQGRGRSSQACVQSVLITVRIAMNDEG